MRKMRWRILPLVFILLLVANIDRANVAFAKTTMSIDLGFSDAAYGFGAGLFFLGYLVLEIPGGLIVQRWGARRWTARILVTWGICTILVGFVRTANEFYAARFLLGLAEAGFVPGIVVYLSQWFPSKYRARAFARFVMGTPVSLAVGGPLAGLILKLDWFNLPGWRWLFILEGLPAIFLGIMTWYVMTDRPQQAEWLSPGEREWVLKELDLEKERKAKFGKLTAWQALHNPYVLALCAMTLLANIGLQGFYYWLPNTVEKASGLSVYLSATISGFPFVVAVCAQWAMSWSSDRTGERFLHTGIPLLLTGLIFPLTAIPGLGFGWLFFLLCVSAATIFGFGPTYWVLPTITLGESAAAAAIGFINCFGAMGGFLGPSIVGYLLTAKNSFSLGIFVLSACLIAASLIPISLRGHIAKSSRSSP